MNNSKHEMNFTHTRFFSICCAGILLLTLSACGYQFSGGGALPGGVSRVAVGIFKNHSGEIGVEGIVSSDIMYEFTRNGKKFTYRSDEGDATLSGSILSVTTAAVSRKDIQSVLEQRVTVRISLKLTDPKGAVLWQATGLSENEEYEVGKDKATTERNKLEAIRKLSRRLAEKVYYQMTDNF